MPAWKNLTKSCTSATSPDEERLTGPGSLTRSGVLIDCAEVVS